MIVIAKRVGRLANRMLLFAHFIGAACEHGFTVLNPSFGPSHARYFPATARQLVPRFPSGRGVPAFPWGRELATVAGTRTGNALHHLQQAGLGMPLIRLRRDQHLDLNSEAFLRAVRSHRVLFVQDWFFRNADNCVRHREAICSFFTPWEHHLSRAREAVALARRPGGLVVGLHIRRGDYHRFKDGRFFYPYERYRQAAESTRDALAPAEVSFLVCSDEPVPQGALDGLDVLHGPGHEVEDLYALAHCDRILGPPSTFNSWASYWGDVPLLVIDAEARSVSADDFHVAAGLEWDRDPPSGSKPPTGAERSAAAGADAAREG